jgi:hypothetical protein
LFSGEEQQSSKPPSHPNQEQAARDSASDGRTLAATATMLSVYDGRTCIGFLLSRGKLGHEAFDADEHSLGVFPSMKLAFCAVSIAALAFSAALPGGSDR